MLQVEAAAEAEQRCITDQTSLTIAGGRHRHPSVQTPLCRDTVATSTLASNLDTARCRTADLGRPTIFGAGVVINQERMLPGEDEASLPRDRVGRRTCRIKPPEIVMGWGCTSQEWVQTCRCRRRTITRRRLCKEIGICQRILRPRQLRRQGKI